MEKSENKNGRQSAILNWIATKFVEKNVNITTNTPLKFEDLSMSGLRDMSQKIIPNAF